MTQCVTTLCDKSHTMSIRKSGLPCVASKRLLESIHSIQCIVKQELVLGSVLPLIVTICTIVP